MPDAPESRAMEPRGTFLVIDYRLERMEQALNKVTDDHERRLRDLERFMAAVRAFGPLAAAGLAGGTALLTRLLVGGGS